MSASHSPDPHVQPQDFAEKWRTLAPNVSERVAYQEYWTGAISTLCPVNPLPAATTGQDYAFKKHVKKVSTGETGFTDVFKRNYFIAEYKAQGKCLGKP